MPKIFVDVLKFLSFAGRRAGLERKNSKIAAELTFSSIAWERFNIRFEKRNFKVVEVCGWGNYLGQSVKFSDLGTDF